MVETSLLKMEKLASNDKEMIQLQRQAFYVQQLESVTQDRKHEGLQRNYEAVSFSNKVNQKALATVHQ